MNIELPHKFTGFLKMELAGRNKRNPRYSLRSFSKTLDLSSSFVSKLLTGKRPLTEGTFDKISTKLSLNPEVTTYYRNIEFANHLNNRRGKWNALLEAEDSLIDEQSKYKAISMDQFSFIADWYHFAILELLTIDGFTVNPNYISSQLGITPLEAQHALDRLLRLGFIHVKKTRKGVQVFVSENHSTVGRAIATAATKKQQENFLKMAIDALRDIPIEQRSQSSMTMAIPKIRLKEAEKMICDFRRNMTSLLQRKGRRDSVYQLSISFYPLTKGRAR